MVKKKKVGTKKPRKESNADRFPLIEKALRKRTKADIICLVMTLAKNHGAMTRDRVGFICDQELKQIEKL